MACFAGQIAAKTPLLALSYSTEYRQHHRNPHLQAAKDMGCDEATVNFFLPLGTTVNMCGTALYEATTAIFIAQVISFVVSLYS